MFSLWDSRLYSVCNAPSKNLCNKFEEIGSVLHNLVCVIGHKVVCVCFELQVY